MEDPKPTPCLMGLPAELRNAIWEMVFEGNVREIDKGYTPQKAIRKRKKNKQRILMNDKKTPTFIPNTTGNVALLHSCKQIRREAVQSYYENTTFTFTEARAGFEWIGTMFFRQPQALSLISDIHFDTAAFCAGIKSHYPQARARFELSEFVADLKRCGIELKAGVLKGSSWAQDGSKVWSSSLKYKGFYVFPS